MPEQVEAIRRRGPVLGERPNLWEVRIAKDQGAKDGYEPGSGEGVSKNLESDNWANVMVQFPLAPSTRFRGLILTITVLACVRCNRTGVKETK